MWELKRQLDELIVKRKRMDDHAGGFRVKGKSSRRASDQRLQHAKSRLASPLSVKEEPRFKGDGQGQEAKDRSRI